MRVVATILISGLMACAGAAQAQTKAPAAAGLTGDVRCLLTMGALSNEKANQPQATFGVFYFAGRIKAQKPGFDFGTELKPVAMKMAAADYQAETKRCGPMVQAVFQGMQSAMAPAPPAAGQAAPPQATPAPK